MCSSGIVGKGRLKVQCPWSTSCLHLINIDISEATLKNLLAEQRKIIEEIKQKTNYYSTRNLLERYDNRPSPVARTPSKATVAAVGGNYCSFEPL